jgi:hypothetical protein
VHSLRPTTTTTTTAQLSRPRQTPSSTDRTHQDGALHSPGTLSQHVTTTWILASYVHHSPLPPCGSCRRRIIASRWETRRNTAPPQSSRRRWVHHSIACDSGPAIIVGRSFGPDKPGHRALIGASMVHLCGGRAAAAEACQEIARLAAGVPLVTGDRSGCRRRSVRRCCGRTPPPDHLSHPGPARPRKTRGESAIVTPNQRMHLRSMVASWVSCTTRFACLVIGLGSRPHLRDGHMLY